jgi:4-amino-4-deoxy-L-arabinose transferase-like glycosyltransferase
MQVACKKDRAMPQNDEELRPALAHRIKSRLTADMTAGDVRAFFAKTFPMQEMIAGGRYAQILFGFALLFSAWYCFAYLSQPILEWHGFRQTQTALTSYWLVKNGFSFAYWTPVVGQGWSIPFEFPIYQFLVAVIADWSGASLTATGRAVSWLFTAGSCVPLYFTLRRAGFGRNTRYFALALFMSSPLYVFWGSTFMIESAALFFVLCFLFYAVKILGADAANADFVFAGVFLTLGLLQKVTTALPVAAIFAAVYCVLALRRRDLRNMGYLFKSALVVLASVLIAYAWIRFADQQKTGNPIGAMLTADALGKWNYGTLEQRLSEKLWIHIVWQRFFMHSLNGWIGVVVLGAALALARDSKTRLFIGLMTAAGLLPLLVFTNLHLVHAYYQTANLVFLLLALSVAATVVGDRLFGRYPGIYGVFLFLFVLSNFDHFAYGYLQNRDRPITKDNNRILFVSDYVKSRTGPDQNVIWYGVDWSSEMAFYSERKSLTIPDWSGIEVDAIEHMEKYLEQPAAMAVLCPGAARADKIKQAILKKYGPVRADIAADCMVFYLMPPAR